MKRLPPSPVVPSPISDEERGLWQASIEDVQPLIHKAHHLPEPQPIPKKITPSSYAWFDAPHSENDRGLYTFDPHVLRRLQRQRNQPDVTLDLHDYTQTHAHARLVSTIEHMIACHQRVLLVITGKGTTERPSVLRAALPRWCEEAPLRGRIIAIHHATQPHGGKGAFYLHLRIR